MRPTPSSKETMPRVGPWNSEPGQGARNTAGMRKRLRQHGPQMLLLLVLLWRQPAHAQGEGWIRLFDGKSLEGWTASESQSTYRVENGVIVARGPRAHLYYTGPVLQHNFKNFEFRMQVKTAAGANSGLYFQTHY